MTINNKIDMDKLFKVESLMKKVFKDPFFTKKICSCVGESKIPDSTFSDNECVMVSLIKEAVTIIPPERR